jgi:hypothetical protein
MVSELLSLSVTRGSSPATAVQVPERGMCGCMKPRLARRTFYFVGAADCRLLLRRGLLQAGDRPFGGPDFDVLVLEIFHRFQFGLKRLPGPQGVERAGSIDHHDGQAACHEYSIPRHLGGGLDGFK